MISIKFGSKSLFCEKNTPIKNLLAKYDRNFYKSIFAVKNKKNGEFLSINYLLDKDSELEILEKDNFETLQILRHSCAHLLYNAVFNLFPNVKAHVGPVIKNGFYYDFFCEKKFSVEDLKKIEIEMQKISKKCLDINKISFSKKQAKEYLNKKEEKYKIDLINKINENEEISFFKQGNFFDLCKGPHILNTSQIQHFKLLNISGAYWKNDKKNEMLQRIYGTAWMTKKDLKKYLVSLEEMQKRDHRKIGKSDNIFFIQDNNPGMIFWENKGTFIYEIIKKYIREKITYKGYKEVQSPQLLDIDVWKKSGHWENFKNNMFFMRDENKTYALKPMNCPCHVNIYKNELKSYKDFPLRIFEFGNCHRNETSGSLHGLMRTKNFVQDDAHIFCMENQIQKEVILFNNLLFKTYKDFGFSDVYIKLSTKPKNSMGSDVIWGKAQSALEIALKRSKLKYNINKGDGAFYGPKIEYSLKDSLGRIWQCGTIQVDFVMPNKLNATYISKNGKKKTPVMLHRAALGSLERFIGIIIENTYGKMPTWLAPVQVIIINVSKGNIKYINKVRKYFIENNIRTKTDLRNEKIGFKVREHILNKIPYIIIVGNKEEKSNTISLRIPEKKQILNMTLTDFFVKIRAKIKHFK